MAVSVTRCDPKVLEDLVEARVSARNDDDTTLAREALAERMFGLMTQPQRDAVELRMCGLSLAKVAELLGISIRSVRARERRGLEAVQRAVESDPKAWMLP